MIKRKSIRKIVFDNFIKKFKESNLKITPQRIAILEQVLSSQGHPSAEEIYNKIKKSYPNISFDTVNRTLLTFADIGILDIVEGTGDVRRFDPNDKSHHHFRCKKCERIEDFYYEDYDKLEIPENIKEKFNIKKIRVILEGICDKCISSYSSSETDSNP